MKKLIIILIGVLIVVFVALSFMNRQGEYAAEKQFYKATKLYNKITSNPEVPVPRMVKTVEDRLKAVIDMFPESGVAKKAHLLLIDLYMYDKKYTKAVDVADKMIERYKGDDPTLSQVHFAKGLSYQNMDQWNKALDEFEILKKKYFYTTIGLQTPFYIVNYYNKNGKAEKASQALGDAIEFYKELSTKYKGTAIGYTASNNLTQAYIEQENYEDAYRNLRYIVDNYTGTVSILQQLPYVELIFVNKKNNIGEAVEAYIFLF